MKARTSAESEKLLDEAYKTEVCTCGQPRRLHADSFARGHGPIQGYCRKYTWDGKSGPFAAK